MNSKVGKATAKSSTPATEKTTIRIVSEIDWKVRSRQRAISNPIAPPATPEAAVTANRLATCPNEMPPKRAQSESRPTLAPRMIRMFSRPATSLPTTISGRSGWS